MVTSTWPTETTWPTSTCIRATLPAPVEGIGATAFSFSNSRRVWSNSTRSPSPTTMLTTVPESAPSASLGSVTSMVVEAA